jgi:subtilase family serine protease
MRYSVLLLMAFLTACGGGGGGGSAPPVVVPVATPTPIPNAGSGTPLSGPALGPRQAPGWGPVSVANALQFPVQSGFDGTGFTVAIIAGSGFNASDLTAYSTFFSIPRTLPVNTQLIDGATQAATNAEATLDVETVAGLAPGANVTLYVIPTLGSMNIDDALNTIVSAKAANIVSMSFGGCEIPGMSQGGMHAIFAAGAGVGIAFAAASGDQGNECAIGGNSGSLQIGVTYPASDPNVIGVGGTEDASAAGLTSLTSTTAWNDTISQGHVQEATGGGISSVYALPAYQANLAGAASTQARNVPDLSLPTVDDPIFFNGGWELVNGTSWSTPQFAALLAEVYEYCNSAFNNAVNVPYAVFAAKGYGAFLDVTSSNNQFAGTTPFYSANAGYDNATGIGVPLGVPFMQALCPNRVPSGRARTAAAATSVAVRRNAEAFTADVAPHVAALADLGERDANAMTRIQIVLQPSGTVATDEQAAIVTLQAAGLTIVKTFPNHVVVDAQGPAVNVERLFATKLHNADQGRFGTHYLPVTTITVPASLAPFVAGVTLDDVVTMTGG